MNITSERLHFRPYADKDFSFLRSMLADPEMMRYIGNGRTRDKDGAQAFADWIRQTAEADADFGLNLLVRKSDGRRIGHAGLVPQMIEGTREIEIGYWIARLYWNSGFATEAAQTLRDDGVRRLGIQRFIALIQPGNVASINVARKLGMEIEKTITLSGRSVCVYALEK